MTRNATILEAYFGNTRQLGGLRTSKGLSGRAENRIAQAARVAIVKILNQVVDDVRREYHRTGNAYNIMRRGGVRATGTTLNTLKGVIIGPEYIQRLEGGGTILPQKSEYLAIPIFHGVRPDGTPKLPGPRSWRNIVKTFVYKSKDGRKFIAYKQGKDLRIIYVLVDEVEVKGKGRILQAFLRRRGFIEAAIIAAFNDEMDRKDNHLLAKARISVGGGRRK